MIDKKQTQHIAKLARLDIKEEELEDFQKDLSKIIDYFNIIEKVDTSNVPPTFHPTEEFLKTGTKRMREDQVCSLPPEIVERLIDAFPKKEKRYLLIKSIFQ